MHPIGKLIEERIERLRQSEAMIDTMEKTSIGKRDMRIELNARIYALTEMKPFMEEICELLQNHSVLVERGKTNSH